MSNRKEILKKIETDDYLVLEKSVRVQGNSGVVYLHPLTRGMKVIVFIPKRDWLDNCEDWLNRQKVIK